MRPNLPFFMIALFLSLCHATAVYGEIYSANDFSLVDNVIVKFKGPATLQIVANGNYSVDLPEGKYVVEAFKLTNGSVELYSKDYVEVKGKGMEYDIVLFYPSEFEEFYLEEFEDVGEVEPFNWILILLAFLVILFAIYFFFVVKKDRRKMIRAEELDEDAKMLLKILKENEGRMEQKEAREILGWSYSKMSLVVGELEALGYLRRIKKGRKNIIKLRKF